ncbi:MAG: SHOCT domain-containing protein [Oscillospiraceae bacterium]|nr:SHOCT domain-containing protein [Oscillospiraceae bacterium]MBP3700049.1 SHOCT domain-containing protein [Oscillospiraceae bacterium]
MGGYLLLNAPVFLFLILGFMAVNAIICLVSVLGNSTDRDGKAHVAFAIVAAFLCFWSLITDFTLSPVHLEISALYKAFVILCSIAIVVIAVIKRSSRIVPAVEKSATTIIQAASSADELKKYKELLDSGVITQEEFDAKKKQLMGL